MDKLVLIGAGSHAKVIADIINQIGHYEIIGLIDPEIKKGFMGLKVLGDDDFLQELYSKGVSKAFVSIGLNRLRHKVFHKTKKIGFDIINVISPNAIVSSHAQIGQGVAIMPGAIVNAYTHIGNGCILNTNCSVDHDGRIGNFVHIAPGTAVAGAVSIGENTFCGIGSRIIDGIKVGKDVIIGAGGVAIHDIEDGMTVIGIPAQPIRNNKENRNE